VALGQTQQSPIGSRVIDAVGAAQRHGRSVGIGSASSSSSPGAPASAGGCTDVAMCARAGRDATVFASMRARHRLLAVPVTLLLAACDGGSTDAPTDADLAQDAVLDAALDTNVDASADTSVEPTDASDASDTDAAVDAAALAITDVRVEPNPNSALSCFVSWKTSIAADSSVEIDPSDGVARFRIRDGAAVTTHRVLVIGLHAVTGYQLTAASTAGSATARAPAVSWTSGALPAHVPLPLVRGTDATRAQPGWTLVNLKWPTGPAVVAMYDHAGKPVWYSERGAETGARGDVQVSLTAERHVLVGPSGTGTHAEELDLAGDVLWTGRVNPNVQNGLETHHYGKLDDGTYVTLRDDIRGGVIGQSIDRLDASRATVWTWSPFDHLTLGTADWTHGNSVTFTSTRAYVSYRNLHQILAIDRADGHVIWRLGAGGDFTMDAAGSWFAFQHDPELESDGRFLVYDNGDPARGYTRVLEVSFDETAKTAKVTWEYPGKLATDAWYSQVWGDVDRLANGDVLVTAGRPPAQGTSRVFEVTKTGEKLLEFVFSNAGVYRAERVVPPLIEAIP
jgi:hypothetical protein